MTWQTANRVAAIAAAQACDELGIDTDLGPIDVGAAIDRAGVALIYRPLPSLFGVYLRGPSMSPGILVNSSMIRAVRRHTAAHELGHHLFGHQSSIDSGADADNPSAPLYSMRPGGWPDEEKLAESFASWFLMPRRAVAAVLTDMGVGTPQTAAQVYQLALRLGTTFAATVRHLGVLKVINQAQSRTWSNVAPARLKRELAGDLLPSTRGIDVWDIATAPAWTPAAVASPGDIVVIPADISATLAVRGPAEIVGQIHNGWAARCVDPADGDGRVTVTTPSDSYSLGVMGRPHGSYRPFDIPRPQATEGAL